MPVRDIQYPVANTYDQSLERLRPINVTDAGKDKIYYCLGCNEEMRPYQGKIRASHFQHNVSTQNCNHDETLHKTAQALIEGYFNKAQSAGDSYMLRLADTGSAGKRASVFLGEWDAITPTATITLEDRVLVPPYRPDIVIRTEERIFILEIEVTSRMESKPLAYEEYKTAGYLTLCKSFKTFDELDALAEGFVADRAINFRFPSRWNDRMIPSQRKRMPLQQMPHSSPLYPSRWKTSYIRCHDCAQRGRIHNVRYVD